MRIVTTEQMRRLEEAAVAAGATWPGLMEMAGWGVAQEALRLVGPGRDQRALVLVGPGNNGGDGLVVARHLHDAGMRVVLYVWRRDEATPDANWDRCRSRDIAAQFASHDEGQRTLRRLLAEASLVVDGLLGMGTTRPIEGELAAIVAVVNERRALRDGGGPSGRLRPAIVSIDVPTGINSDTGAVLGAAVQADVTVATGLVKQGLLLYPGKLFVGTLALAEIGVPSAKLEAVMSETLTHDMARKLLPARPEDSHKGTFGKVLVVAGSLHYPGAATLASSAAARAGAGLVTLAAGRSILAAARTPEVTLLPLPEADWGTLGEAAATELFKHLEGYTALLVGPGLGKEEATGKFFQRLLGLEASAKARARVGFRTLSGEPKGEEKEPERTDLPALVIDADGLNLLAQIEDWHERLPKGKAVLTPHPGEMKRLLDKEELDGDSIAAAREAAERWGQVVVLKGATSVIASPEGRVVVHAQGNPALATAGTGDVLAGTIAALLAQGLTPFDAAVLGVYLHGAAGALVREEFGDMGAIASDLLPKLPKAAKALRG